MRAIWTFMRSVWTFMSSSVYTDKLEVEEDNSSKTLGRGNRMHITNNVKIKQILQAESNKHPQVMSITAPENSTG